MKRKHKLLKNRQLQRKIQVALAAAAATPPPAAEGEQAGSPRPVAPALPAVPLGFQLRGIDDSISKKVKGGKAWAPKSEAKGKKAVAKTSPGASSASAAAVRGGQPRAASQAGLAALAQIGVGITLANNGSGKTGGTTMRGKDSVRSAGAASACRSEHRGGGAASCIISSTVPGVPDASNPTSEIIPPPPPLRLKSNALGFFLGV